MKRGELRYPWNHWHLVNELHQLADPKLHDKWRKPQPTGDLDTFWGAIEWLADDLQILHSDPTQLIGECVRNEVAAGKLGQFVLALNAVLDSVGSGENMQHDPSLYLDHPGWAEVVRTARAAHKVIALPDYEGI